MYAIITAGGKQHRVVEGETLSVDFMKNLKKGDSVEFNEVLMLKDSAGSYKIGKPSVAGAKVTATVVQNGNDGEGIKGKKIMIFKKRRRHVYKKMNGFRPLSTSIKIEKITA